MLQTLHIYNMETRTIFILNKFYIKIKYYTERGEYSVIYTENNIL